MSTAPVNPSAGTASISLAGLDIETALMAVQTNRANILEGQLKLQMEAVQAKNDQISKLNAALGDLNALATKWASGDAGDKTLGKDGTKTSDVKAANAKLAAAGMSGLALKEDGSVTKGQVDAAIQKVKAQIDGMSNSQQMDMLRLQSLSNKRNEAFEIMTNFIKKLNDNRSAIVGNMR